MTITTSKSCISCGNPFETADKRKVYCSGGCRQDAFRARHSIATPAFLQPKGEVKTVKKIKTISKQVVNPDYEGLDQRIRQLEGLLTGYNVSKSFSMEQEAKLLSQDDELLTMLTLGAIAVGVGLLVGVAGFKVTEDVQDEEEQKRTRLIILLVAISLAGLVAAASVGPIKDTKQRQKVKRIADLKQQVEQYNIRSLEAETELAVLKTRIKGIPKHLSQLEDIEYHEQQTDSLEGLATLGELKQKKFNTIAISPELTKLIGEPETGFAMVVHGSPGQGKSTFTTGLAKDLADYENRVLFIAAEEGFSKSLQQKFSGYESDRVTIGDCRTLVSIKNVLKGNKFDVIILDSVQQLRITPEQLTGLRRDNKSTSFIYILQATKSGHFKGDNSFAHDADVEIKMVAYEPQIIKTRYK